MPGKRWTDEEKEIMKKWYPKEGTFCHKRLPDRTRRSVENMAFRMNIKSPKNQPNDVVYYEKYAELVLLDHQYKEKDRTKVDLEDVDRLLDVCRWSYDPGGCGYVQGYYRGKNTSLHRFLMDPEQESDLQVDHINGDGLDNRKKNLRLVTQSENLQNITRAARNKKSGLPLGVSTSYNGSYRAVVTFNGDRYYLGTFDCPDEAHEAYIEKRKELVYLHRGVLADFLE